jgi:hypothetical protein
MLLGAHLSRYVAVLLLLSVSSFGQSFTKADYAVGSNPRGVASADFNRDGVADLAVANSGNSSVSILLGRGDGTFGAATAVAVAANPNEIVSADFNGDGIADLAVAGTSVTILLGNGDGTFRRGDFAVNSASITSADFNADGKLDLAVTTAGKVQILIGDGAGAFTPGALLQGEVSFVVVRAGDLNRDGSVDLAIGACCQGEDVIFGAYFTAMGKGDGTFTVAKAFDESDGTKLTVSDVNGDGAPDLIMPYQGCHTPCDGVEVATNQGGSFTRFGGAGVDTLDYVSPGQAAVGNFSGGTQIAVPFGPGDYTSNGNGAALDKVLIFTIGSDGKSTTQRDYAVSSGYGAWGIVAADFNHDGKTDLAVTDTRVGKITVLLNATAPADFALTTNFSPQTVKAGDKTQFQYVLEATNGTLPQIQLSCSGLPTGATCAFDNLLPGQVTVGWVTVQTTARTGASLHASRFMFFALVLPFGFVVLPGERRRRLAYVGVLLLICAVMLQLGCGGGTTGSSSNTASNGNGSTSAPGAGSTTGGSTGGTTSGGTGTGSTGGTTGGTGTTGSGGSTGSGGGTTTPPTNGSTPAGTYQVRITATGGGVTHTQSVTLIVQ